MVRMLVEEPANFFAVIFQLLVQSLEQFDEC